SRSRTNSHADGRRPPERERSRPFARHQEARGLCPRAFRAKAVPFPNKEDPRLRLRGAIPLRRPHLPGEIFGTWLCGPATLRSDPAGEAPPAADPGVWLGRKMDSLYEPFLALSSSSVK